MAAQLLRALPGIAFRCKHFSLKPPPLPLLFLNSHSPSFKPTQPPKRCISTPSVSASSPSPSSTETPLVAASPKVSRSIPSLEWVSRTAFCGELSEADVNKRVRLCGWVALHRVHGGLTFVNLRDHTGVVQITTLPNEFPDAHSTVNDLRVEYVVAVEGVVRPRPIESVNKKMRTGAVEVAAERVHVLNTVRSKLPFLVTTADDAKESVKEEIRLRYRCLDLRRPQMTSNIILRHQVVKLIRRYLEDVHGFVEIETPILSRSTPEGARDYLVPSRIQPGTFYALPQSPQLFKQMLMVSGFDKYYQIARCFRDEDLRADRQPEFTQLDMEMAFTPLEDMLRLNEDLIRKVSEIFSDSSFKAFADTLKSGGIVKALCVPSGGKTYSNTALKKGDIYNEAIKSGAKGLPFLKVLEDGAIEGISPLVSCLDHTKKDKLLKHLSAGSGDLILFAVGQPASVNKTLDRLRLYVAHDLGLIDPIFKPAENFRSHQNHKERWSCCSIQSSSD
ncbi:aspartate--tRNA ligase, chloroplastic/mitochondrial-like isoform X3 [Coffea eugenioides]|uniref:aspartate--tRNA ligase, chloroplastic/mitochondrial-like isoform X3 n=1 Tax=Coffea eugenioides TaxID=49369 RepID=UPI000F60C319|nr:aspartate--tRNA ligase, chloroplastic/mitochondrial-like isoform X3 [Coffea eugenioides]